ncbi:ABC transporter ATP-binding protein [Ruegeria marina]|uniref:Branched-chain amino acid transport system ATP-binding protein n=1 Tax=Ruegeria marina TaxID=639004 RepID=A0A1G7FRY6_9RHOB|nr:ABC transporter ATP-binding protein [Ruegeria marina]SDE78638.1 branched-chain amino acid transport system ATP-binding protein [Ruegeria marina]
MLQLNDVHTWYGSVHALRGVSLTVGEGEIVSLLGGNACGKSTTMKTILGWVKPRSGEVIFGGQRITGKRPPQIVDAGIAPVLERRRMFPQLTVRENLMMGAWRRRDTAGIAKDIDKMAEIFPVTASRAGQAAGTLSGGEQQMVAMARALMARPKLLIMDEPSMGLSPKFVRTIFDLIIELNRREGLSILVVEQNANMALSIASRGYVLQTGEVVIADTADALLNNPQMQKAYLGIA